MSIFLIAKTTQQQWRVKSFCPFCDFKLKTSISSQDAIIVKTVKKQHFIIHRGDFVGFDIANEDDVLEEFLGLPRKHAKVELVNTGAIANEVGQFTYGKLKNDEKVDFKMRFNLTILHLRNPQALS